MSKPSIPLEDVWSPGTVTREKALAYKRLEKQGQIELVNVRISQKTGVTRFIYRSVAGKEQTAAMLRKAHQEIIREQTETQMRMGGITA